MFIQQQWAIQGELRQLKDDIRKLKSKNMNMGDEEMRKKTSKRGEDPRKELQDYA